MRLIALKSGLLAVATVATAQAQLPVNGYAPNADQLLLGFVGYELLAMTVHNGKAVAKGTFDTNG